MSKEADPGRIVTDPDVESRPVVVRLDNRWRRNRGEDDNVRVRVEKYISEILKDDVTSEPARQDREVWNAVASTVPGFKLTPLLAESLVKRLIEKSRHLRETPDWLNGYVVLDTPRGVDAEELAGLLKRLSFVENAYPEPPGSDPQVSPDDPEFVSGSQGYLEPAPEGIDARFVWDLMVSTTGAWPGKGVRLVDVEQGWTLTHEDLPAGIERLGPGVVLDGSRGHGTAVLGIIGAVGNNGVGCIGIAPGIEGQMGVASYAKSTRFQAISVAIAALGPGDVLLIEAQIPNWEAIVNGQVQKVPLPVEADPDLRKLIQFATSLDIVVVEAAGNGGTDLGAVRTQSGEDMFDEDSGAILVSAARRQHPHVLVTHEGGGGSNYGTRISCYAWGEKVTTCWSDENGHAGSYTNSFSNTSAAAAIVAGAAVALQSLHKTVTGVHLTPAEMRQCLNQNGTAPDPNEVRPMGTMPDLNKAATALSLAV